MGKSVDIMEAEINTITIQHGAVINHPIILEHQQSVRFYLQSLLNFENPSLNLALEPWMNK